MIYCFVYLLAYCRPAWRYNYSYPGLHDGRYYKIADFAILGSAWVRGERSKDELGMGRRDRKVWDMRDRGKECGGAEMERG